MKTRPELEKFIAREIAKIDDTVPELAFSHQEYDARLARVRAAMAAAGLDMLVVSSPSSMCWLHGYQSRWYKTESSTGWPPMQCSVVHVDHDRLLHFDVGGHERLLRKTSAARDLRLDPGDAGHPGSAWASSGSASLRFMLGELRAEGWLRGTVGLEMWSPVPNRAVSDMVESALVENGCRVRDASAVLREARRIKSPAEIAAIERAAHACDAGLLALQQGLRPGMSELEAWSLLMSGMTAAGGEPAALHECVYVGTNHIGHTYSSRRRIAAGDLISADPCGVVNRYHANVARQLSLGEPEPEAVRLAAIEGGAYAVIRSVAKAGTPVRDVNRALREYFIDAGAWELRNWIGGYELGVSMPPDWVGQWFFSAEDDATEDVIEAGVVTNFESMTAFFMIDTVVFEENGARTLSKLPAELLVVDC
jgi:Xaa-Pro dipeptidase